jgi:uncharacterized membrane protein
MSQRKRIALVYFLTLGGILLWVVIIFLAPYLKSRGSGLNAFAYMFFAPICHQIPGRSICIFGHPLAVCARCLGIYIGFLGGMGIYALKRGFAVITMPKVRTFILVTSPLVLDGLGNLFHLWNTPNWLRLSTGVLWGSILPFYFITGVADFFIQKKRLKAGSAENIP